MFDRNTVVLGGGSHAVPYCSTVIEKRAPTDKSVELLKEMQSEARDSLFMNDRVDFNGFKCNIYAGRRPFEINTAFVVIKYNLNGVDKMFECNMDLRPPIGVARGMDVVDAFSHHLTRELVLEEFIDEVSKTKWL